MKDQTPIIGQLLHKINQTQSATVVGLDPQFGRLPKQLIKGVTSEHIAEAFFQFNCAIIDAIHDLVPAVKIQLAFYERYGLAGMEAVKKTIQHAKQKNLLVIIDGKRNDIGNTAQAYADAYLSNDTDFTADFLTVTPYLGMDGIQPFVENCKKYNKGIFVLVKTSNKSSGDYQDRYVEITDEERAQLHCQEHKIQLYNLVALHVNQIAQQLLGTHPYSPIGAAVGATYPNQAKQLRSIISLSFFLVPGYGAQGGTAKDVVDCFNSDGYGAVVNASRSIIFAYEQQNDPLHFAQASRLEVLKMNQEIHKALEQAGKLPQGWKV